MSICPWLTYPSFTIFSCCCQVWLHQLIHPGLHRLLHPCFRGRRILLVHHSSAGGVLEKLFSNIRNNKIISFQNISIKMIVHWQDLLRATEYTGASGVYAIRFSFWCWWLWRASENYLLRYYVTGQLTSDNHKSYCSLDSLQVNSPFFFVPHQFTFPIYPSQNWFQSWIIRPHLVDDFESDPDNLECIALRMSGS